MLYIIHQNSFLNPPLISRERTNEGRLFERAKPI